MSELDRRIRLRLASEQGDDYVDLDRVSAMLKLPRKTLMLAVTVQSLPSVATGSEDEGGRNIVVNVSQALEWHREVTSASAVAGMGLEDYLLKMVAEVDETMPTDLLQVEQAAALWGVPLEALMSAIADGEVNTYAIGSHDGLVSEGEVAEWSETAALEPEPPVTIEPEPVSLLVPERYKDISEDNLMALLEWASVDSPPTPAAVAEAAKSERAVLEVDPDLLPLMSELSRAWQMPIWAPLTLWVGESPEERSERS